MNVEMGVQLDLVGAIRRRAPVMASVAIGVFLVAYWMAMVLPNEYTSYVTMLVQPPSINQDLVSAGAADQNLNTRLNLMTAQILSRPRLSRMIDELGLYREESEETTRDAIIDLMRGKVSVIPVEGALVQGSPLDRTAQVNTFQIYFTDDDQGVPSRVAQALAQDFIDEHIAERVEITQKSLEFIEVEERRLEAEISGLRDRIGQVKVANMGSLPDDRGANERILMNLTVDLETTRSELASALSEDNFWTKQVAAIRAGSGSRTDEMSPERRKTALEMALAEYRSRGFTEKHPDVIDAKLEIEEVKAQVTAARSEVESDEDVFDFSQMSAVAEQERAALRSTAAREKIDRIQKELEAIQIRADAAPRVAQQLDGLEREWRQRSGNLNDFENRKLTAAVQANLERRQLGEQFGILEPAFRPLQPSAPNRVVVIGIGFFLGIVLGLGVGIGLEAIDPSVYNVSQAQGVFAVPVLAAIPSIRFEADLQRVRSRRLRLGFASAVFVGFNLAGGALAYFVVNGFPTILLEQLEGEDEVEVEVEAEVEAEVETPPAPPESEPHGDGAFRVPLDRGSPDRIG